MRFVRATTTTAAMTLVAVWAGLAMQAAAARAAEPQFARHLTAEHKQVFALNDPLPHVQKLLNSPALRKVLLEGRLGAALRKLDPTAQLDPVRGWEFVRQNQRWVPAEFAVGVEDSGVKLIDTFFRLLILSTVGRGAAELDDDAATKEALKIEALALAEVKQMQVPAMRLYVRMRQPADAAALVGLAGAQLKEMQQQLPPGAALRVEETKVQFAAKIGDLTDPATLAAVLDGLGVVTSADSPAAREMAKTLAGLRVEAALEAAGDGIVLTIGRPPTGSPLKAADLGPLFRWDAGDLWWARWDLAQLKPWVAGWAKLWGQWKDTKFAQAAREQDENDFLGSLEPMAEQLRFWGATGQTRAWVDERSAVRVEVREQQVAEAPALAGSPLLKFVPATAEAYEVQSAASAADLALGTLMDAEGRMEVQSLKADLRGGPNADLLSKALAGYYVNFADARALLVEKAPALFEPGAAWMIGTRGTVPKFALRVEHKDEKLAFEGANLPMMEFALIGRPKNAQAGEALMSDLSAAIAKGFLASAGVDRPKSQPRVKEVDLGLGRKTWAFDGSFVDEAAAAQGAKVSLTLEGDLRPHYFTVDGFLVFSTSARLSREIIASATGTQQPVSPPVVADGRLVDFGRFPGQTVAAYVRHAGAWVNVFAKDHQMAELFEGFSDLSALMGEATWEEVQQGPDQTTRVVVTAK
jgi:hypothetical protein